MTHTKTQTSLAGHSIAMLSILAIMCLALPAATQEDRAMSSNTYTATINAPEFPKGLDWINTPSPIELKNLRGKIVLLDFWTYCCINCMHVIPDLKRLEKKYPDELVVIGVHSAKFTTEQETENIYQAVQRYGIQHPVVNDSQMEIWKRYAVRAWPTLVLIDPDGKVAGQHSGEGIYKLFDQAIGELIQIFDGRGTLDRTPLQLHGAKPPDTSATMLRFPGKVLADPKGNRLFISDSGNHRIVVASLDDHRLLSIIGTGSQGLTDGDFSTARFNDPQGLAVDGELLYVADRQNHAIRTVDLAKNTVSTLVGKGKQGRTPPRRAPASQTSLNSPWALWLHEDTLFIAMAGPHQIWKINLKQNLVDIHAGTGQEARIDGSLLASAFAQPSGLTSDGKRLYVADSEISSIRAVDISPNGEVSTLAGGNLFDFGDRDGPGLTARFQHPLGVAWKDGMLYIADTYNNKIKRLNVTTGWVETIAGIGKPGTQDGPIATASFDEPGGISISEENVYVADTNNHLIRRLNLRSGLVSTIEVKDNQKR